MSMDNLVMTRTLGRETPQPGKYVGVHGFRVTLLNFPKGTLFNRVNRSGLSYSLHTEENE